MSLSRPVTAQRLWHCFHLGVCYLGHLKSMFSHCDQSYLLRINHLLFPLRYQSHVAWKDRIEVLKDHNFEPRVLKTPKKYIKIEGEIKASCIILCWYQKVISRFLSDYSEEIVMYLHLYNTKKTAFNLFFSIFILMITLSASS